MAGQLPPEEAGDPFTAQANMESFFFEGAPHPGHGASVSESDIERSNSKLSPHFSHRYS